MKKKEYITQADKDVWGEYIKNPKDVYDKDLNSKNSEQKLKCKFDLHGYTLADANIKAKELIITCYENKYSELLLITGKGIHSNIEKNVYVSKNLSKLKYSIPDYIKKDQDLKNIVSSVSQADVKDGGEGAVVVKLKKLQDKF